MGTAKMSTLISMAVILLLVFVFVPWQVAYLACWIVQFSTCASLMVQRMDGKSGAYHATPQTPMTPYPGSPSEEHIEEPRPGDAVQVDDSGNSQSHRTDNYNHNMHLLLFMTWLLPLAAPVLVVWVRTLAMAGLQTPFDGDHFFLNVAPFLILVDFASWSNQPIFERQR
jgi:GPI inositol-deacylase